MKFTIRFEYNYEHDYIVTYACKGRSSINSMRCLCPAEYIYNIATLSEEEVLLRIAGVKQKMIDNIAFKEKRRTKRLIKAIRRFDETIKITHY